MENLEKKRKLFKWIQNGGMIAIVAIGMVIIYFFGLRKTTTENNTGLFNTITYVMGVVIVLFFFLTFAATPMQNKLLKLEILESIKGLNMDDVKFDKKKGFTKESFQKLYLAPANFSQYGCADYYSFRYNGFFVEGTTIRAFDEYKLPKQKGVKKSKSKKVTDTYFHGRIYIIPYKSGFKANIYGKKNPSTSKKKELQQLNAMYKNELPIKVKKYSDVFEVFYNEDKPANIQPFLEKLFYLKMQAKGIISCFLRDESIILCIDNGHFYQDVDFKNKIDETLIRQYRKDVSMVLSFLNNLDK